ncbi:MAG: hypothetical protein PHN31_00150 [Candidatus Gracilibacteria bacterium]|nr:hypothetical protein [Candidatus Gracilibacteria bacterium]
MYISNLLGKRNLNELVIKSILWNSIIEIFRKNKNFNILPFLVSIKINNNIILVKVSRPIIKTEVMIERENINNLFKSKITKVYNNNNDFIIKYVV